jgi:hypothetical protein
MHLRPPWTWVAFFFTYKRSAVLEYLVACGPDSGPSCGFVRLTPVEPTQLEPAQESSALSPKSRAIIEGGYLQKKFWSVQSQTPEKKLQATHLSPLLPPTPSIAFRIPCSSSLLSWTSTAFAFSSRYLTLFVPGMGMKSSP